MKITILSKIAWHEIVHLKYPPDLNYPWTRWFEDNRPHGYRITYHLSNYQTSTLKWTILHKFPYLLFTLSGIYPYAFPNSFWMNIDWDTSFLNFYVYVVFVDSSWWGSVGWGWGICFGQFGLRGVCCSIVKGVGALLNIMNRIWWQYRSTLVE